MYSTVQYTLQWHCIVLQHYCKATAVRIFVKITATATKVSVTAQDHARIRAENEVKARTPEGETNKSEVPLPPPCDPPGSDESGNEETDEPEKDNIEPSNSDIVKQKHGYKLVLRDSSRKFQVKTYGAASLALFACEEFRKTARSMMQEFDAYKKKPSERRDLLTAAGCDDKFLQPKTSIQSQHDALLRRLCNGLVSTVENSLVDKLMLKLGGDMDMTRMSMKPTDKGFSATYKGTQTTLQQSFPSLQKGFAWLKELLVADKVGVVVLSAVRILFLCGSVYNKVLYYCICAELCSVHDFSTVLYIPEIFVCSKYCTVP